jgi:antitoxin component of RelBE/YafQ-DinJ toxin-antitoxin module
MTFTVEIEEEIFRAAERVFRSEGITPEQAIATYLWRIAHNEEPVDTNLHLDGAPMPRTVRQQLYRFS